MGNYRYNRGGVIYLSGIGGFCFQNSDFWVRNPILRDLSTNKWPLIYDLSKQTDIVRQVTGDEIVAFSYYFTWWLPVAGISKIFHFNESITNLLLFLWAVLGILLVFYGINRYIGLHGTSTSRYGIIAVFTFFSGLDFIIWYLLNKQFPFEQHIEWWAKYFQYSSNITQIFWVFNQSIPVWIIVLLFLQLQDSNYAVGLSSLVFAYSPWATFGMIPLALVSMFRKKSDRRKILNLCNVTTILLMLIIYGSFYTSGNGTRGSCGVIFSLYPTEQKRVLLSYILFIFLKLEFILLPWEVRH